MRIAKISDFILILGLFLPLILFHIYFSDGLIDVELDSELKQMPNFIQRAVGAEKLKVGVYEPSGTPVDKDGISQPLVNIRPLKPFGIDPKSFGKLMFILWPLWLP